MTTVVWDGTYMVADSQVTQGDTKDSIQKIYKVKTPVGTRLVGIAGAISTAPDVLALVSQGLDPKALVPEDMQVMIVSKDYCLMITDNNSWKQAPPCIMGTGTMAAKAAFALGYDALTAVKVACQVDLYSSGPIKKLRL